MESNLNFIDLDAEKELIALFASYPEYIKEAQKIIKPEIFHYGITRQAYLTCIELYSENGTVSWSDLLLRLKTKGTNDWITIMDASTTLNPLKAKDSIYYLAELKGKRDLLQLSKDINTSLMTGSDYFKTLNKVVNFANSDDNLETEEELLDMKQALGQAVNNIGNVMTNGALSGVPTGFPKLDEFTGGWLNGNVVLLAGRPGQGKTICLLEHAKWASKLNNPVLFLSLEMPVVSLIYRMISGTLDEETPYSKIKTGRISIDKFQQISGKSTTELQSLPITWYDGANRDINYLSSMIQRVVREKGIKMVVIDYLQLITDNQIRSSEEFAVVGSVSKKIQQLSKKLNIPFLVACQLNRASESRSNHRPKLSDLRSSGQIEQDASVVIGLYRDDYYAYEKAKEEGNPNVEFNNEIEYIFLKNRDGDTTTCQLYINVKTSSLSQSPIYDKQNPEF